MFSLLIGISRAGGTEHGWIFPRCLPSAVMPTTDWDLCGGSGQRFSPVVRQPHGLRLWCVIFRFKLKRSSACSASGAPHAFAEKEQAQKQNKRNIRSAADRSDRKSLKPQAVVANTRAAFQNARQPRRHDQHDQMGEQNCRYSESARLHGIRTPAVACLSPRGSALRHDRVRRRRF